MDKDIAAQLAGIIDKIKLAAEQCDSHQLESVAGDLHEAATSLNELWVATILTVEAVQPIFSAKTGLGRTGELSVMDLCYNSFMLGRNGIPQDPEAARYDWFNDTHPLMRAGVERLQKETLRRMEYATADRDRRNQIHRAQNEEN